MPITTWQPSTSISSGAVGHVLGTSVDTCQRSGNTFSPTTKRVLWSGPTHHTRRMRAAKSDSSSDGVSSDDEGSVEEFEEEEEEDDDDDERVQFLC